MIDNAVPRQGYAIVSGAETVGRVTSGSFSPSLKRNLGLAYVSAALAEPGSAIAVVVRGAAAARESSFRCRTTPIVPGANQAPLDPS